MTDGIILDTLLGGLLLSSVALVVVAVHAITGAPLPYAAAGIALCVLVLCWGVGRLVRG